MPSRSREPACSVGVFHLLPTDPGAVVRGITTSEFCWRGPLADKAQTTRSPGTNVYRRGSEPRRALLTCLPVSRLNRAGNPRSSNSLLGRTSL
jgi:hypothetical protein